MNTTEKNMHNFASPYNHIISMMKYFTTLLLLFTFSGVYAQNATLKGFITDSLTKEALVGASVTYENNGITSNEEGFYTLSLPAGKYTLTFSYLGYTPISKEVTLENNQESELNIALLEEGKNLDEIVISANPFGKRVSEEVISIKVIKPDFIDKVNPLRFDDIARRVTGLNVVDGQANIRAGSGWSYGVGSRVMIVLDGQPMLTPDRSDVRWNHLPTELIGQIEVLKGASSVLYGSSAMNGTISLQTIKPTKTPYTKFISYAGALGSPKRDEIKWWRSPRMTTGASFVRAHKPTDNFEYVVGATMYTSDLQYETGQDRLARLSFTTKWNKNERIFWGVRGIFSYSFETEFFYWQDGYQGAYKLADGATNEFDAIKVTIDPFLTVYGKKGIKHDFKNRIYISRPEFADKPYTIINNDYQVSKKWDNGWSLIGGINAQTLMITEDAYGGKLSANILAGFVQAEKKWNRLSVVAGTRFEGFRFDNKWGAAVAVAKDNDGNKKFVSPGNWRFGLNYQAGKNSYIRANFGQAFRFPSLAERYAQESLGIVTVYRNPELKPEYGWTSEIGFQQKINTKSKVFTGSFDAAFFWQEYNDLVEFLFDFFVPDSVINGGGSYNPLDYAGFKSLNLSRARIAGYEITFDGTIAINKNHQINFMAGYSYSYPVDLNTDTTGEASKFGNYLKNLFAANFSKASNVAPDIISPMLKYRNRHLLTIDLEYKFKGFSIGGDIRYYSYMEKVDDVFNLIIPDIFDYRAAEKYKGNFIVGFRTFYQVNKKNNVGIIIRNLTNNEYYLRPPKLEAPISYMIQYKYEF